MFKVLGLKNLEIQGFQGAFQIQFLSRFPKSSGSPVLVKVLKEWANPFDHREPLIHISSCIVASHTVKNDLLGLEEMKRFWDER